MEKMAYTTPIVEIATWEADIITASVVSINYAANNAAAGEDDATITVDYSSLQ